MTRPGSDCNGALSAEEDGATAGPFGASKAFDVFVAQVRDQVEALLSRWLAERVAQARRRGGAVGSVADAVAQLTLRGGKRMRAVLLAAAYEACGGEGGTGVVAPACACVELLQSYLLVHDDWMDGDETRRGGPSVPAVMRARYPDEVGSFDHGDVRPRAAPAFVADVAPPRRSEPPGSGGPRSRADAMSILAGDLGAAWAMQLLFDVRVAPLRLVLAARELARVEEDVVEGQVLDVAGQAHDLRDVEAMHALKTSSYSVRGPLVIGARLAGAGDGQVEALVAFAEPLGVAFQLRDDLLGVFGDAKTMGKPAGNDLRAGKRSAVVVDALAHGVTENDLGQLLGRADASDAAVASAIARLVECGTKGRLEARIQALVHQAIGALDRARMAATGRALLCSAVGALTHRQS